MIIFFIKIEIYKRKTIAAPFFLQKFIFVVKQPPFRFSLFYCLSCVLVQADYDNLLFIGNNQNKVIFAYCIKAIKPIGPYGDLIQLICVYIDIGGQ